MKQKLRKIIRRLALYLLGKTLPTQGVKAVPDKIIIGLERDGWKVIRIKYIKLYADWLRLKQVVGEDYNETP